MSINTTLVVNAKGGVGKTTIATNLASYFAANGVPTAIMDYDPQGSSLNWLNQRASSATRIHGANGAPGAGPELQSYKRYIPPQIRQLVIDPPAAPARLLLQDLLRRANSILIPVAPSAIDIHATANFIKELLLVGRVRHRESRIAVVANRVRTSKPVYTPLERFLQSLRIQFLTYLSDSDVYVQAAETGIGVFEMDPQISANEQREFLPIVQWLRADPAAAAQPSNIVPLNHSGRYSGTAS